jgi:hypothetical protein
MFKINTDIADPEPHTWGTEQPKPCPFNEGYYMRGEGSNYKDYKWLGEVTLTFAIYLQRHLGMTEGSRVLDVGCARGFLVRALRMMRMKAFGYDISDWAIENCDPEVTPFVSTELSSKPEEWDYVLSKDTLEHVPIEQLKVLVPKLCQATRKALLFIVPLTGYFGGKYLREEDEADSTHLIRFSLTDWLLFLQPLAPDFTVSGAYHIKGCKAASEKVQQSCGFLTLTRI